MSGDFLDYFIHVELLSMVIILYWDLPLLYFLSTYYYFFGFMPYFTGMPFDWLLALSSYTAASHADLDLMIFSLESVAVGIII